MVIRNHAFHLITTQLLAPLIGTACAKKRRVRTRSLAKAGSAFHALQLMESSETDGSLDSLAIALKAYHVRHLDEDFDRLFKHVLVAHD